MGKRISILFDVEGTIVPVTVDYTITVEEGVQLAMCAVNQIEHKRWLQTGKFELRAQLVNGVYAALFNDKLYSLNDATTAFIDQVHNEILEKEQPHLA